MIDLVPLKAVEINNFRGVRSLRLELHPRITVLFGGNANGKSTILDALGIALGAFVARVPKARGRGFAKSGDIRVPAADDPQRKERRGVERAFAHVRVETASGDTWSATQWRSPADRRKLRNWSDIARSFADRIDASILRHLETPLGLQAPTLPLFAAYGNERAVVEAPLSERGFQTEFPSLAAYDGALKATTRFRTVFEWFRVQEDEERRQLGKRKDFGYRLPELEWVRRAVAKAELHCANPRVETKPIRMLVDFDRGAGPVEELDIEALSDGYRTHFALVVDIARRMVQLNPTVDLTDTTRGTNSPAVVLIDEVDLHLDPVWQARVVRGLTQAFPNAQFVVTTHSEQVLGSVGAECVRSLSWVDGEIVVGDVPFAQGASGERILIELMGAPERVPGPVTDRLGDYLQLVDRGEGDSAAATALRADLEVKLRGDARLHLADLEMEKRSLLRRIRAGAP